MSETDKSYLPERIVKGALKRGQINDVDSLIMGRIKPSDLQWILSGIFQNIVKKVSPSQLLSQQINNRFVSPTDVSQKDLILFDYLAMGTLPDQFEMIELSPLNPLGTNSVLTPVTQRNVISTSRNSEVCADVATALALESARRRQVIMRSEPYNVDTINLCSSQRVTRAQQFNIPGFTSHFKMLGLCTAGRSETNDFEGKHSVNHIEYYLKLFQKLSLSGYNIQNINIKISDIGITENLIEQKKIDRNTLRGQTTSNLYNFLYEFGIDLPASVNQLDEIPIRAINKYNLGLKLDKFRLLEERYINKLRQEYPAISFSYDIGRIAGIGYYNGICFKIAAQNAIRNEFPLVDGGSSDWSQKTLSDHRESLVTSGIGSEIFCRFFKNQ